MKKFMDLGMALGHEPMPTPPPRTYTHTFEFDGCFVTFVNSPYGEVFTALKERFGYDAAKLLIKEIDTL